MLQEKYFVRPPEAVYTSTEGDTYLGEYRTYSHYNYFRPGLISRIKRSRFERALRFVSGSFGRTSAIDVGCADGIFLPSLARHFVSAVGVEPHEESFRVARRLVDQTGLRNVTLLNNGGIPFADLRLRLPPAEYGVAFVLETLEHIGPPGGGAAGLYEAKVDFLNGVFSLLSEGGRVIISVPKMVGLGFLLKYLTQVSLRLPTEKMPLKELFKSSVLRDTEELEKAWCGTHLGFNQVKLGKYLRRHFTVERERHTAVTTFFVLRKSPAP